MATTTATITLSSTDLLSDELALSTTATLTKTGTATGTKSTSDIYIKPSVETGIEVEHMLFYQ